MEDRLLKLLDTEQLSSSKFADVIGVQRSSVSHILTGRNKPSFDFLQKTLKAFPMLNADWLILGEGEMYEGEHGHGGGNLFDLPGAASVRREEANEQTGPGISAKQESSTSSDANIPDGSRPASEISGPGEGSSSSAGELGTREQIADIPAVSNRAIQHQDLQQQEMQDRDPGKGQQQGADQLPSSESSATGKGGVVTGAVERAAVSPGHPAASSKRVRRVILFYDDNSFEAYEQG